MTDDGWDEKEENISETTTSPDSADGSAAQSVVSECRGESERNAVGIAAIPAAERAAARLALACSIYEARLDRALFFRPTVFGDFGWDALLAIYVFGAAGYTLSASELCNATCGTSLTSALRMQRRLSDLKLIRRIPDPNDARRVLIELTEDGRRRLEEYLDHVLCQRVIPTQREVPPHRDLLDRLRPALELTCS